MDNGLIDNILSCALFVGVMVASALTVGLPGVFPRLRPYLLWLSSAFMLFPFHKPNSVLITLWVMFTVMVHTIIFDEINLRWLYRFVPDRCQMNGCKRKGYRGWENLMDDGLYVCDYCSVRYYLLKQGLIKQ